MPDYSLRPTAEYRFFLYDPEGDGMIYFKDKAKRDEYGAKAISEYLDNGEWIEEVEYLCAGDVTMMTKPVDVVNRPADSEIDEDGMDADGEYWDGDAAGKCNYALLKLTK